MTSTGNSVGTKPQSGGVHPMNTPLEALERLKGDLETWPLNADSGTAGRHPPEIAADLRSLLSSYEAQGERLREVEGREATNLDRVREFHETFGVPVMLEPCIPADRVKLRLDILDEERRELDEALDAGDVVEVADALTDMAYLIYGTALEFGIDLNACFAEVHRSNMSKLGADGKPIYREDGKVLKGPDYSPPDLRAALTQPPAMEKTDG